MLIEISASKVARVQLIAALWLLCMLMNGSLRGSQGAPFWQEESLRDELCGIEVSGLLHDGTCQASDCHTCRSIAVRVDQLLRERVQFNISGNTQLDLTPVFFAAYHGYVDFLSRVLIRHPQAILERDLIERSLEHYAAASGELEALRFLTERGGIDSWRPARPRICHSAMGASLEFSYLPFHYALVNGQLNVISYYLNRSSFRLNYLRELQHQRISPGLHAAMIAYSNHRESNQPDSLAPSRELGGRLLSVVSTLLDLGESPSIEDPLGRNALGVAIELGDLDLLSLLLARYPALVVRRSRHDLSTPIHLAANTGRLAVLQALLGPLRERFTLRGGDGNSWIDRGAYRSFLELRDHAGQTARDLAAARSNEGQDRRALFQALDRHYENARILSLAISVQAELRSTRPLGAVMGRPCLR